MQRALAGLIVAAALAVSASGATFLGIDAWKIVLAAAGAVIFVMGAERRPPRTTPGERSHREGRSREVDQTSAK